jgi:alpha-mannosidase
MKKVMWLLFANFFAGYSIAQTTKPAAYNIGKDKVLYTVPYAHLDTEWNWDYPASINEYIKNIMTENFALFEKYPDYVFNFTGSRRYHFMKEYYPDLFKKVQYYVRENRWHLAGSSVDEAEANLSSSESIIRQVLYGNQFFKRNFNTVSRDYMIPDCFGFVANLPSILHHCGLIGFSTQKLTWHSANGIPFNVGIWNGPDGKGVVSALNCTGYSGKIVRRLDLDTAWDNRLTKDKERTGYAVDYRYFGVGDQGGAPRKTDVVHAVGSMHNRDSRFKVILSSSDQMYKDIEANPAVKNALPVYTGDLLLIEHSAGSSTSQSYMKRLNRKNEFLAAASESVACMADLVGNIAYPVERFDGAWELVLGSQFHDILPGTSIPKAYEYAHNDEFVAANNFASILKSSLADVSSRLNTQGDGRTIVVYNPVARQREDVVSATMNFDQVPKSITVEDGTNTERPAQIIKAEGNKVTFVFKALVPSLGLSVFNVKASSVTAKQDSKLKITDRGIENESFKVTLADNGDIISIVDKINHKELLASPAKLEFLHECPKEWPSWNMDWEDRKNPPIDYLDKNASIKVVENGPVRVALEVTRAGRGSSITQTISLAEGNAGRYVNVSNKLNWQSQGVSLKAAFPLSVSNTEATYNLGVGVIMRGNNVENKFEVPAKEWFDLTDRSGSFGVSILEDCKYASDKPDDNTVRLTLMYTPEVNQGWKRYYYQATQDFGVHHFNYGIYSHSSNWNKAETAWMGKFMNQPLLAFEAPKHSGSLGKQFSFLNIDNPNVGLMACKKKQQGDYYIIRVNETGGNGRTGVHISFPKKIKEAFEVNGQEEQIGKVEVNGNSISFSISKFTVKSFAVRFETSEKQIVQQNVELIYDKDVMSADDNRSDGEFAENDNLPAELIPDTIVADGISFKMGSREDEKKNAVACKGQIIELPKGNYKKLYLLAAADNETDGSFVVGGQASSLKIEKWTDYIGQFYNRVFSSDTTKVLTINSPYTKRADIAWFASHVHHGYPSANRAYRFCYLKKYEIDLPIGATSITLPDNEKIKVMAITAVKPPWDDLKELQPLYDDFSGDGSFTWNGKQ